MNTQKPTPEQQRDPNYLGVVNIWHTIQGEGPFSGEPAFFLRLAGCNLQCPFCDTDYTYNVEIWSAHQIATELRNLKKKHPAQVVVITGGEPLRWNLNKLLWMLEENFAAVQIETNGTYSVGDLTRIYREGTAPFLTIVCSPKTPNIHPTVVDQMDALKYVVAEGQIDERGFPVSALGNYGVWTPPEEWIEQWRRYHRVEIYNSPLDTGDPDQNQRNYRAAAENCLKHGFRLSLQVHKLCGLD